MLHTSTFPFPGSQALVGGDLVTIRQHVGEQAIVAGPGIWRRVPIADLAPPPEASLFDRWCDERLIVSRLGEVHTPVAEVHDDYCRWLADHGAHDQDYPTSLRAFLRMMREAGHFTELRWWRNPGDDCARHRRVFALALAGKAA